MKLCYREQVLEALVSVQRGSESRSIDVQMTLRSQHGHSRPEDKRSLGIYRLDGDRLTLCLARDGEPRPTALSTEAGKLLVFERVKKK